MGGLSTLFALAACFSFVLSHTVITYPGWRGNNLIWNGYINDSQHSIPPNSLGINYVDGQPTFPYGMQWMYPCGGMPTSQNRTKWPVMGGGAIGIQPGWFSGHSTAYMYINMGFGNEPVNMSFPMLPVFQINGPSNNMYEGEICLTEVPLPANTTVKVGDNATIQVIETAQHGAALYNCVDITFADPQDVPEVNETNCRNSTDEGKKISYSLVFATTSLQSAGYSARQISGAMISLPTILALTTALLWL